MGTQRVRGLCALFVISALILIAAPAAAGPNVHKARLATRYIRSRQNGNGRVAGFSKLGATADAVLALAGAHRSQEGIDDALRYLRRRADRIASVGLKAKVVMAVRAGGRKARSFGGENLVAEIKKARRPSGRYGGAHSKAAVLNHALALLALNAAGVAVPPKPIRWLRQARCSDGGWQYDAPSRMADDPHCYDGSETDVTRSDTNTTSYAVQALDEAVSSAQAGARFETSFAYFRSARDHARGGWRYSHQRRSFGSRAYTDANSTALVLQAYAAVGKRVPRGARKALRQLAYEPCGELTGAVAYTWIKTAAGFKRVPGRADAALENDLDGASVIGATVGAVLGFLRLPLPLGPIRKAVPASPRRSCSG